MIIIAVAKNLHEPAYTFTPLARSLKVSLGSRFASLAERCVLRCFGAVVAVLGRGIVVSQCHSFVKCSAAAVTIPAS